MNRLDDLRLNSLFQKDITKCKVKVAIIGYAIDEGVRRNGGRVGAKKGPDAVRKIIQKKGCTINEEYGISLEDIYLKDFGSSILETAIDLKLAHEQHIELVKIALDQGFIPIVIGGGNDQSYPNYVALSNHLGACECLHVVNIDAHLDVRPLLEGNEPHSGSAFRQMLEADHKQKLSFVEFAVQGSQCSKSHVDYLKSKGVSIIWFNDLHPIIKLNTNTMQNKIDTIYKFREILSNTDSQKTSTFVSFDIDSIRASDCPGVSCPGTLGLTAEEAIQICFESGKNSNVKMIDFSEFNPDIESERTGLLITNMIYYFLLGLAYRNK